ncbi:MAG TPA: SRPBCC family protein [Planctomycetota bacterium]|nr:SRPBCC family protein [Planctomycetota bacterium]
MAQEIVKSVIVRGGAAQVFDHWMNFENWPRFMKWVRSIKRTGPTTTRWTVEGPLGADVTWDCETTLLEPGRRVAWNTRQGSDVITSGQVTFHTLSGDQTEIAVRMNLEPKGGVLGGAVAKAFANPDKRVETELQNFKQFVEGTHAATAHGGG